MEQVLMLLSYVTIIGLILYAIMFYGLKQSQSMAEDRSILAAALLLAYMVLFGRDFPREFNKNIF